ncbi:MAG: hypothetical protein Q9M91_05260 [Candidatus Dojkabacteria bacterium]|nr:hypothetical protein [Candidatus Dojkabacteria bacterium]MDQ7021213.1 hypothetical protein [Candidatus Dojkabacteria bacterium]
MDTKEEAFYHQEPTDWESQYRQYELGKEYMEQRDEWGLLATSIWKDLAKSDFQCDNELLSLISKSVSEN